MTDPLIQTVDVVGYEDYYATAVPAIENILDKYMKDDEYNYLIGINEAVCNAARYAIAGYAHVKIHIRLFITEDDITTTISAETKPWDVELYRHNMQKLAANKILGEMEWGDYTASTSRSRGFWLMLMSCEYLYIDISGKKVSLCARRPFKQSHISKKIKDLIPRLYLEKNGVIF